MVFIAGSFLQKNIIYNKRKYKKKEEIRKCSEKNYFPNRPCQSSKPLKNLTCSWTLRMGISEQGQVVWRTGLGSR
jgi:hypothetical protein